ncbi:MAG: undecaprenyldiphospho-muramoylpentapeptide beta-N-acetylglucosaminyltransferase [Prevotellaceae bacterium]|jgi:UDP-N-acetylglucosamine--N-acetylmuramyl-(pentapeptide) pyrophosphoryl-undecaprenol N-acetylglucosamine transferase|nr:undecaprenyldiphospho-muramoylpentapeptide beta-N-acetylglucosaminyltransferase [Prevotellaceae bacterium]
MKRVIISGGGTGGHIFPAISIANMLKEVDKTVEILFVGAEGRMEMEKIPAAGYNIVGLPVVGLQRKLTLKNFLVPFKLFTSLRKSTKIIKDFKPDAVIGVGGYASAPVLKTAQRMGIPTLIQEQNSYAGVTNKLLSKKAAAICVAYQGMERFFPKEKLFYTGNPVRQDLFNLAGIREEALRFFGLDPKKPVILSLGGSLGARTMNESVAAHLSELERNNIQIIWQTGKYYFNAALQLSEGKSSVKVCDFIQNMKYAFSAADIIISRAGAGTISELCIVGKPAILTPSPNVAEDHQTKNAMALVRQNAAIMIKDEDAQRDLIPKAVEILGNTAAMKDLSVNIAKLALPDAAKEIVKIILTLYK